MDGDPGAADQPFEQPVELRRSASRRVGAAAAGCFAGFFRGFRDFILRGNVVDLAVAVVVGNAFTDLVSSVASVTDWLTPAVAILFNPDALFASLNFTVRGSIFPYGHFLNTLLSFVLILIIVTVFVVTPMNAVMKTIETIEVKKRKCPECLSDIPVRARRCKHCCAAVEPIEPKKKLSASSSKLVRHGSAPVPAQQHPQGDKIMARAQTLPVGAVLPLPAGAAPLPAKTASPGMAKGSPSAISSKVALLEAVPEDSPSPASSFTVPASVAAAAAASAADAAGAAAEPACAESASESLSAGGSLDAEGAGDSLANWQPSRPLFKTSSIHVAALQASPDYSWLPASPASPAASASPAAGKL
ncbi:hypothetical protein ABPG75_001710 [Micractinium tetrahymenae]